MRRKRSMIFIALNGLLGLLISLGILAMIVSPYYVLPLIITLAMMVFIFSIYHKIVRWIVPDVTPTPKKEKSQPSEMGEGHASQEPIDKTNITGTPLENAYRGLLDYVMKNESTPFFKSKLQSLMTSMENFGGKYRNLAILLVDKFGVGSLSYEKFMYPVSHVCEKLTAGSELLVHNLWHFDEEVYTRKINDLRVAGKLKEAEQYISVEKEYKTQVYGLASEFDTANLKLDRLILEITRLGGSESEINLEGIDDLIEDIKLYKSV